MKKISILLMLFILWGCSSAKDYYIVPPHENIIMEFRWEEGLDTYIYIIDVEKYTMIGDDFRICGEFNKKIIFMISGEVEEITANKCDTIPLDFLDSVRISFNRDKSDFGWEE